MHVKPYSVLKNLLTLINLRTSWDCHVGSCRVKGKETLKTISVSVDFLSKIDQIVDSGRVSVLSSKGFFFLGQQIPEYSSALWFRLHCFVCRTTLYHCCGTYLFFWYRKSALPFKSKMLDPKDYRVLNEVAAQDSDEDSKTQEEPLALSKLLNKNILKIKGKYISEETGKPNYKLMRQDEEFKAFQKHTRALGFVNISDMDEKTQKAFFLNLYNTLTLHALTELVKEEKTLLELDKFWSKNAYKIGEFLFSLDDMEHGVLRGNQLHPSYKDYFFKENDPRRGFTQTLDARIHFALNCGAKSCPPIRLFTVDNLETALDLAAKGFCQNSITVNVKEKTVMLSKIFMWYGSDFGKTDNDILQWILGYLEGQIGGNLVKIIDSGAKIRFTDYDWSVS